MLPIIPVSVVCTVYNKANYLPRSLDTLKKQTLHNFEIVFADDFSTDNSSSYIKDQMKKDSRIKLVQHIYNQGTCSSRNHAILSSKGLYIMFLDPDDEFINTSIEISYKNSIMHDADVLEFEVLQQNMHNRTLRTCIHNFNNNKHMLDALQEFRYYKTNWNLWKKIIKKDILIKAIKLIMPFVENKRIWNGEDILLSGAVFIFMKNYICGHFVAYIYYKGLPDSAFKKGYDSRWQKGIQTFLSKTLAHYFYLNKDQLSKCSLKDFLKDQKNSYLYSKVYNIDKTPKINCINESIGFIVSEIKESGYCIITTH